MMYFIGVSTAQSSIMKVFPRWAEALGLDAALTGMDFPLDSTPSRYREAVGFIKDDPLSLGALVTTHKVNLLKAARDFFDDLDPLAVRTRGSQLHFEARDEAPRPCERSDQLGLRA